MTIHQAKGLEFDRVILPNIDRTTKCNTRPMFLWKEQPGSKSGSNLILAPLIREQSAPNQIYNYLYEEEKIRDHFETTRLLYVAITRAKRELYLLGCAARISNNHSFLSHLNAVITTEMFEELGALASAFTNSTLPTTKISHLVWQLTAPPIAMTNLNTTRDMAKTESQLLGTVVHQLLSNIHSLADLKHCFSNGLSYYLRLNHCLPTSQNLELIEKILTNISTDPRGQWILASHLEDAYELPLTRKTGQETLEHYRIDRSFIDEATGIRWIIDYKITAPSPGETLATFTKRESDLHRPQLTNYAALIESQDPKHPIKIALYYPILPYFLEISC